MCLDTNEGIMQIGLTGFGGSRQFVTMVHTRISGFFSDA